MMGFQTPWFLIGIFIPLVIGISRFYTKLRPKKHKKACGITLPLDVWNGFKTDNSPAIWHFLRALSAILYSAAWISLSIAAAGPVTKSPEILRQYAGLTVVFAIDVSPSMAASDVEPTRLESAKNVVRDFINSSYGVSVGIVAFGVEAALLCPPSTDYSFVIQRLNLMQPGLLGDGTAIGQGLAGAYKQISLASSGKKDYKSSAIILLSDGEDNIGLVHSHDVAESMSMMGASFIVLGIGSSGDVPIEYTQPLSGQKMSGSYRSSFNDESLSSIAAAGHGLYKPLRDNASVAAINKDLAEYLFSTTKSSKAMYSNLPVNNYDTSQSSWLFAVAIICAAAAWFIRRIIFGAIA